MPWRNLHLRQLHHPGLGTAQMIAQDMVLLLRIEWLSKGLLTKGSIRLSISKGLLYMNLQRQLIQDQESIKGGDLLTLQSQDTAKDTALALLNEDNISLGDLGLSLNQKDVPL